MTKSDNRDRPRPLWGKAISNLLQQPTLEAAAAATGVSIRTLQRWQQHPLFRSMFECAKRDLLEKAMGRLTAIAGKSVDRLDKILDDPEASAGAKVSAIESSRIWTCVSSGWRIKMRSNLRKRVSKLEANSLAKDVFLRFPDGSSRSLTIHYPLQVLIRGMDRISAAIGPPEGMEDDPAVLTFPNEFEAIVDLLGRAESIESDDNIVLLAFGTSKLAIEKEAAQANRETNSIPTPTERFCEGEQGSSSITANFEHASEGQNESKRNSQ